MMDTQLPSLFGPLFAAAFIVNAAYVASVFALKARLGRVFPAVGISPRLMGADAIEMLRMVGFFFSAKHTQIGDEIVTRLVWTARVLFVAALALTTSVVVLMIGAA